MRRTQTVDQLVIRPGRRYCSNAALAGQGSNIACITGRGGIGSKLFEGDSITPIGRWRPLYFLYRKDRVAKPVSLLPGFAINKTDSWCDKTASRRYNLPLAFVPDATAERLWRDDNLYDLVVVIDHNAKPAVKNRGSAVFLHLFNQTTAYTQGCIAFSQSNLLKIIQRIDHHTQIRIQR